MYHVLQPVASFISRHSAMSSLQLLVIMPITRRAPITAVKNRQQPGHVYRAVDGGRASVPRSLCRLVGPCRVWRVD